MGHSGDPRPQSLGRKDHTLGHCGLGLGGTVATPSHWHGRGSTFNVQLEYSFVSILSAREIVDCPRRTRNGIPVGPHVGRFRSHSSTFNVQPPLPPRISSIVYIPNLVRLIVVDGRTTQVAPLSRCNHQIAPFVNVHVRVIGGYAALVRLGRLKYNAAQLTSNHGVDSLPAKIFIRGVFHCNIIPTGSKYANSGFSSPVFYFSSFFSIALLTFLSPFISLLISLSATVHQYVAYSMPLKSPGVNAYHLSKHVVLPQT